MARRRKRKDRLNAMPLIQPQVSHGFNGEPPQLRTPRDIKGADVRELPGHFNMNVDRLEWLYEHKNLDDIQYNAGRRLQSDWQVASLLIVSSASQIGGKGARNTLPDAKLDAMQRHSRVLAPLPGRIRAVVEAVIQENMSLEKAAAIVRVNRRAALPLLQAGLDMIARGYSEGVTRGTTGDSRLISAA